MRKLLLTAILCILLLAPTVCGYNTKDYITKQNHFLNESEALETPAIKLLSDDESYLVVPVVSGDALVTFIPLTANEEGVSTSKVTNRELFEAADVLRGYVLNQQKVSKTPSANWYVTPINADFYSSLSSSLLAEPAYLNLVGESLNSNDAWEQIYDLVEMLGAMSDKSLEIEAAMRDALALEAKFKYEVDADEVYAMDGVFGRVFSLTQDLEVQSKEYHAQLELLKQTISLSDIDFDSKSSLLNVVEPPPEFEQISKQALDSRYLELIIDEIYLTQVSRTDDLLEVFESKVRMNSAYKKIYTQDEELLQLSSDFISLADSVAIILNNENKPYWVAQDKVQKIEVDWRALENAYNRADYELAEQHASRVKSNLKSIYRAGFVEVEPEPLLSQDLIYTLVFILIALLIIIYAARNRENLMKKFAPEQEEEEEVDIGGGWENA